jgi:cadmium resistance protein CadD (predicted permease)
MLTAASAFSATNLDDIFVLTLLFSRLDHQLRAVHVVGGQLIGFTLLVLVSLSAYLGRALLPLPWLGLLGLLPISLGVSALLESWTGQDSGGDSSSEPEGPLSLPSPPALPLAALGRGFWAPLGAVALLTMANGSDNIGVYLPLFARASAAEVGVTLITFAVGLGLWCLLAWQLTKVPGVARGLRQQAGWLVPVVLIVLGCVVLADSHCLEQPLPALIALISLAVMALSLLRLVESLDPAAPLLGFPVPTPAARTDEHRP